MDIIYEYFLYFLIYACIGWLLEVSCKLVELKRFVNRGFLLGPICPIYGYGVLLIIILIGKPTSDVFGTFLKSIFVCSILEYLTSYFMEKLFKARWWDYSRKKFNLNGRICADTMIPFGILGCLMIYIVHPFISSIVLGVNTNLREILAIAFFILYIADNIFSFTIVKKIKNKVKKSELDNTEAIKEEINTWFRNNSIVYKRIIDAYPTFMVAVDGLKTGINDISAKTKSSIKKGIEGTTSNLKERLDYTTEIIESDIKRTKTILVRLNDIKRR